MWRFVGRSTNSGGAATVVDFCATTTHQKGNSNLLHNGLTLVPRYKVSPRQFGWTTISTKAFTPMHASKRLSRVVHQREGSVDRKNRITAAYLLWRCSQDSLIREHFYRS